MPAQAIHKFLPTNSAKSLVQLNSNWQQYPDGYITVPISYMVTPLGLSQKIVKALAPKPNAQLNPALYSVRNLPENKGLFINEASVFYENGLHFVDLRCSTCTQQPQYHIEIGKETQSISSTFEQIDRETGELLVEYFSFTIVTPVVRVKTSHLTSEDPEFNPRGLLFARGDYAVVNTETVKYNERLREKNIINVSAYFKGRFQHEWTTVSDRESANDGNISRTTYTVSLRYTKKGVL